MGQVNQKMCENQKYVSPAVHSSVPVQCLYLPWSSVRGGNLALTGWSLMCLLVCGASGSDFGVKAGYFSYFVPVFSD